MKSKKATPIIIILLFVTAAICGFYYLNEYMAAQNEIAEYTEIQNSYTSTLTESAGPDIGGAASETAGLPYVTVDFDTLLAANPETVGWLAIPDTEISYPVLQAGDNNKYLNTSFSGERSRTGAVFMDSNNTVHPLDKNTIVYGHHMTGREDMFGSLLRYNEKAYYDAHKWIQFDTIHKQYGWWQVFAVIHLDVKAGGFDYLQQNFRDAAEFEAWIAQAKALSFYDTGVDVPTDAHILTLSTCNRASFGRSGRQVVLAVNHFGPSWPEAMGGSNQ